MSAARLSRKRDSVYCREEPQGCSLSERVLSAVPRSKRLKLPVLCHGKSSFSSCERTEKLALNQSPQRPVRLHPQCATLRVHHSLPVFVLLSLGYLYGDCLQQVDRPRVPSKPPRCKSTK